MNRQGSHIKIGAAGYMTECHEFFARNIEIAIEAVKIDVHDVRAEMIVPGRNSRMRGENCIDCHTFQRAGKIESLLHQIVDAFQNHECGMAFIDMPDGRLYAERLQCAYTA